MAKLVKKKYISIQTKIARIYKESLELWKFACYKMWGGECIFSGTTEGVVFHHFILKSKNVRMRLDPMNGVPMRNQKEHFMIHHGNNPDKIAELYADIKRKRGQEWCDYIDKTKAIDNRNFLTLTNIKAQRQALKDYLED